MVKILLLQGANLTFLGRREPEIYGSTTPAELDAMLRCHAHDHAYQLEIFYTNIEGEAINRIYQAVDEGFDHHDRFNRPDAGRFVERRARQHPRARPWYRRD